MMEESAYYYIYYNLIIIMKLRVMTFNIRYSGGNDGVLCWDNRKKYVVEVIRKYAPDIIGFQEVMQDQYEYLCSALSDYNNIGVERIEGKTHQQMVALMGKKHGKNYVVKPGEPLPKEQGDVEFVPVFYRGLELLEKGSFWLSDTPEFPSVTWGGLPRICTWANFKKETTFGFYNTHLDHTIVETARMKSAPLIHERMRKNSPNIPRILTGDFNCIPNSNPYNLFATELLDTAIIAPQPLPLNAVTYHDFKGGTQTKRFDRYTRRIDYIWVSKEVQVTNTEAVYDTFGKDPVIYPSDHWPVLSDLSI
jgi:endonuclease/exonuclease/phosphatase family metal-dependent hydrolase